MKRLFEKPPSWPTQPRDGVGGPTYVQNLPKRIVLILYYGNVSYKYAGTILFEPAYSYLLQLFMCEEISFKFICKLMILVFGYV